MHAGAEHQRNIGAVNVGVKQAGLVAELGERQRQVYRQRGLADTPFARTNGDNGVDAGYGLRPWRRLSGTRRSVGAQAITWVEESKG
jgi:hypothetical protein